MNQNLRQCFNSLTVVGTLKSKEVKFGTTANGDSTISLDLVVVSNDVDKMDLVAQAEDSNAKIDISNQTLKIGENTIKITVTAKNKDKKVYTFSINRKEKEMEKENQIDEKDDDVIPISDSVETKKPNKTSFALLLGILIGVMIIDLVIMKKNKYKK